MEESQFREKIEFLLNIRNYMISYKCRCISFIKVLELEISL